MSTTVNFSQTETVLVTKVKTLKSVFKPCLSSDARVGGVTTAASGFKRSAWNETALVTPHVFY